jgi:hypothetical protein
MLLQLAQELYRESLGCTTLHVNMVSEHLRRQMDDFDSSYISVVAQINYDVY